MALETDAANAAKIEARRRAAATRATAHRARGPDAAVDLAGLFLGRVPVRGAVSLFWPMRDEIDVRPLMAALAARGAELCLPVMQGRDRPLLFRRWQAGDPLARGPFGVDEPLEDAAEVRPAVVVVPLLAFDAAGNRLGYGGGYYDRTLRALRNTSPENGVVLAVGVAYDEQETASVPECPWDEPLDMVVTDRRVIDFARNVGTNSGS